MRLTNYLLLVISARIFLSSYGQGYWSCSDYCDKDDGNSRAVRTTMKSDSQIVVNSIIEKIKAQSQIFNLMTLLISQKTIGISFIYYNKLANKMANKFSKKPIAV